MKAATQEGRKKCQIHHIMQNRFIAFVVKPKLAEHFQRILSPAKIRIAKTGVINACVCKNLGGQAGLFVLLLSIKRAIIVMYITVNADFCSLALNISDQAGVSS